MVWSVQGLDSQNCFSPVSGTVSVLESKVNQQLNDLIFDSVGNEGQKNNVVTTEYLVEDHHHGMVLQILGY